MKYLREFQTVADYNKAKSTLDLPNVSLITKTNGVYYKPVPPPYQGFCKLTLTDGSTVELEGSGKLTWAMVSNQYKYTLASAEIGKLCTSIGSNAFYSCSNLTSCTIGNSVTSIDEFAFNSCSKLTDVTIGNSVTSIGQNVFQNCTCLTNVTIGSSVTSIGMYAFNNCSSLTSIDIPSGVTSIGNAAFSGCSNLARITSNATTAPTIQDAFYGVKTGGTLIVPTGSTGYDVWMGTGAYYLDYYNWTKVEQ